MYKKLGSVLLAVALVACCLVHAAAAGTAAVFHGYPVSIVDNTTPCDNMRGRTNDPHTMLFIAADGKELASIAYSDYTAISRQAGTLVQFEDGSSLNAPPTGYTDWHDWWADEFNQFRGISKESRSAAVAVVEAEFQAQLEAYRLEVIRLVNEERAQYGLSPLSVNNEAMAYAQIRAAETWELFSHTRPDGTSCFSGISGASGENIAGGGNTPRQVVDRWMNSPGHRANILSENHSSMGVGCDWNGVGYRWVQIFMWE